MRPFEIIDGLYRQDLKISEQKARFDHKTRITQLNHEMGQYKSTSLKNDWTIQDPVLYELAQKRLAEIEERVQYEYSKHQIDDRHMKIIELNNQALVANETAMQKEILKGNFQLKISEKMNAPSRIEKFAQEPVAYYLHKRRDFL